MYYSGQGALRAQNEAVVCVKVRPTISQGWPRAGAQQGHEADGARAGRRAEKAGEEEGREQLAMGEEVSSNGNKQEEE